MDKILLLEQYLLQNQIDYSMDMPLCKHSTFKIGGNARIMAWPDFEDQIARLLPLARNAGIETIVIGNGSNILFADKGFPGLVIVLGSRFARMRVRDAHLLECESGASLMQLCKFACENGLSGLEFAYGIPGTVGGAVYMNAGAYDGEMKDVLVMIRHLDRYGKEGQYTGGEMKLSYRRSAYTDRELVITKAMLHLTPAPREEIQAKMEDYMRRRKDKQPLEYPSAGSVFRRPRGAYASALIDQCGLKGKRVGGAQVSEKHAGFIVNTGGATCKDVLQLIQTVRGEVKEKTGFDLESEIKVVE